MFAIILTWSDIERHVEEDKAANKHILETKLIRVQQRNLEPNRHPWLLNQRPGRFAKNVRLWPFATKTALTNQPLQQDNRLSFMRLTIVGGVSFDFHWDIRGCSVFF